MGLEYEIELRVFITDMDEEAAPLEQLAAVRIVVGNSTQRPKVGVFEPQKKLAVQRTDTGSATRIGQVFWPKPKPWTLQRGLRLVIWVAALTLVLVYLGDGDPIGIVYNNILGLGGERRDRWQVL